MVLVMLVGLNGVNVDDVDAVICAGSSYVVCVVIVICVVVVGVADGGRDCVGVIVVEYGVGKCVIVGVVVGGIVFGDGGVDVVGVDADDGGGVDTDVVYYGVVDVAIGFVGCVCGVDVIYGVGVAVACDADVVDVGIMTDGVDGVDGVVDIVVARFGCCLLCCLCR